MSGKLTTAAATASGCGLNRTVALVMTPSVPSLPRKRFVRSYPADDLIGLWPFPPAVWMTSPLARTTSRLRTLSLMVP